MLEHLQRDTEPFMLDNLKERMLAKATKTVRGMTERTVTRTKQTLKNNNPEPSYYIFDPGSGTTYLRGKLLGKGGFARCYELTDMKTNKTYAGKIISKSRLLKPHQRQKIVREIELHRPLRHRHIVQFHSFFEDDDNVYIVLENCSRKSLVHVLKSRKTITEAEVRYYLLQVIDGCKYVHRESIIHRDLKLGNMLLNDHMEVKIADFGLATKVDYEGELKMTVCGTPNYIAPEVLQKKGHSFEADIWAIGCVMYAMLCGRPPFETTTLKETYMRITSNKYTLPSHLSTPAKNLIRRCLNPEPYNRPSLDELLLDDFFSSGYLPKELPSSCCTSAPKFPATCIITRPKSYAVPAANNEAVQKITTSLAQLSSKKIAQPSNKIETNLDVSSESGVGTDSGERWFGGNVPQASRLCHMLTSCLYTMPPGVSEDPPPVGAADILWVTKWVDYSNKYGFGYQLADKSVGVLFNDTSRMTLSADGRYVQYGDLTGATSDLILDSLPEHLLDRKTLLLYFATYMDEHLIKGGDIDARDETRFSGALYMKTWFRTSKAIIMYLSNGTLQVNFFDDHTKVILSAWGEDYLVTYIDVNRISTTYRMSQLKHFGCNKGIVERLLYCRNMLQNIIDIEGDDV